MAIASNGKMNKNVLQQCVLQLISLLLGNPVRTVSGKASDSRLSETKWRAAGRATTHIDSPWSEWRLTNACRLELSWVAGRACQQREPERYVLPGAGSIPRKLQFACNFRCRVAMQDEIKKFGLTRRL